MSATHVVIDRLPDTGFWGMWLQWGDSVMQATTAVGTIAAVAVALWLGVRTARRDERQALIKAHAVASVLTVRLDEAIKRLIKLEVEVENARARAKSLRAGQGGAISATIRDEIQAVVDGLRTRFDFVLTYCATIAGYEEYEALSVAPEDLARDLARNVTRADILQNKSHDYWWVFTASMFDSAAGVSESNVLGPILTELRDLSTQYFNLANRCADFGKN